MATRTRSTSSRRVSARPWPIDVKARPATNVDSSAVTSSVTKRGTRRVQASGTRKYGGSGRLRRRAFELADPPSGCGSAGRASARFRLLFACGGSRALRRRGRRHAAPAVRPGRARRTRTDQHPSSQRAAMQNRYQARKVDVLSALHSHQEAQYGPNFMLSARHKNDLVSGSTKVPDPVLNRTISRPVGRIDDGVGATS